ncbi:MAG: DinB family protein, partial [Pseudomonadota bacterium]|nr:DinB family protein [Pseudomonadota bacterium]
MLDFGSYRRRERSLPEIAAGLGRDDLRRLTAEMCDLQLELIAGAQDADATFVPDDPKADDRFAADQADSRLAWTLGHVVVHATASSEEAAAHALTLARGLPVLGRSRYEVPWQEARTAGFLRQRIAESRRMRLAMLDAWPDRPHLDSTYQPNPDRPALNAV